MMIVMYIVWLSINPFIKTDRYEMPQRPSSQKLYLRSFYNTPMISELMQEKLDKSVPHLSKKNT